MYNYALSVEGRPPPDTPFENIYHNIIEVQIPISEQDQLIGLFRNDKKFSYQL